MEIPTRGGSGPAALLSPFKNPTCKKPKKQQPSFDGPLLARPQSISRLADRKRAKEWGTWEKRTKARKDNERKGRQLQIKTKSASA